LDEKLNSKSSVFLNGELESLKKEFEKLKTIVEKNNLFDLFRRIEVAMEALNCPPGDAEVTSLSGVCPPHKSTERKRDKKILCDSV
jgi:hypothetical protein